MAEDPNLLRREILSTFNPTLIGGGSFQDRITDLYDTFPTGDSQNFQMFVHIIQELNRKLNTYDFADQIVKPIDEGFRPLTLELVRGYGFWTYDTPIGGNNITIDLNTSGPTEIDWGDGSTKDTISSAGSYTKIHTY
jgi:hypothetical protein